MITDISSTTISSPTDYMQTSRLTRNAYTFTFFIMSCKPAFIYNSYWAVIGDPVTVSGAYGQ